MIFLSYKLKSEICKPKDGHTENTKMMLNSHILNNEVRTRGDLYRRNVKKGVNQRESNAEMGT